MKFASSKIWRLYISGNYEGALFDRIHVETILDTAKTLRFKVGLARSKKISFYLLQ